MNQWWYVLGGLALVLLLYQVSPWLGGGLLVILALALWSRASQKGVL